MFPEKEVNRMLRLVVNIGHDEVQIIKGHTMAYLTPAQYEKFSDVEEKNERAILQIFQLHLQEPKLK